MKENFKNDKNDSSINPVEEFEPDAGKLEELRALERATLKHKGESKWTKSMLNKNDKTPEIRNALMNQLKLSRQLTDHKIASSDSEAESEHPTNVDSTSNTSGKIMNSLDVNYSRCNENLSQMVLNELNNPWAKLNVQNNEQLTTENNNTFSKLNEIKNNNKKYESVDRKDILNKINVQPDIGIEHNSNNNKFNVKMSKPVFSLNHTNQLLKDTNAQNNPLELKLKHNNFNEGVNQDVLEAFEDENIVDEFIDEKNKMNEEEEEVETKKILKGWGSWTSACEEDLPKAKRNKQLNTRENVVKSQHSKKVQKKANKYLEQNNNTLVIFNEKQFSDKFLEHAVTNLPEKLEKNMDVYDRLIKNPIGIDWNTPAVHKKLISSRVVNMAGNYVKPLTVDQRPDNQIHTTEEEKFLNRLMEGIPNKVASNLKKFI